MLVLSRRVGQSIVIGEGVNAVTVYVAGGYGTVQLAIDAPQNMPVDRHEVVEDIKVNGRKRIEPRMNEQWTERTDKKTAV